MIIKDTIQKSFWALKVSETLDSLETTQDGLSENEAEERLKLFGRNKIPEQKRGVKLQIFFKQFSNPLIILLIIAGAITVLIQDYADASVIFAAVSINALLGFYQENKAEQALSHLKSYIEERVRIIRDGKESEIDASELVPGDIIRISSGDRVPADARLIYLNDFLIDETILTGEALPVPKTIEPVSFHAIIGDQKSMIFSGTVAVQGFANAVVCQTGQNTELGRIALLVKDQKHEQTPLQKAIFRFSVASGVILSLLTAATFFFGVIKGSHSIFDMFLISVAMLVSAVPEGLPVAMTVILAVGVQRLVKKKGIIRKLLAAETLGNTTIILTDKTGTLTQAKMELSKISVFDSKNRKIFPAGALNKELIIKLALLNCDVVIENPLDPHDRWKIVGRPIETAIVKSAAKMEILLPAVKDELPLLDFLPFNSLNKFSAAVTRYKSKPILALFGAPEILLKLSSQTSEEEKRLLKSIEWSTRNGERVIGIAVKDLSEEMMLKTIRLSSKQKFDGLNLLGIINFTDPIRPEVRNTIHQVEQVGIRTIIVTGDHKGTAEAVAREIGFSIKPDNVIDGVSLDTMSDAELKNRLPYLRIVSRVSPEGKVKIARAYQEVGEIVAMTGDGVNDAPSLKQADIGIAMGSGTDVAKDVAEIVLLDDNYHTIIAAINEGRKIMENIRKVIVYLFSSVCDELLLIGGSLFLGIPLPLTAIQILWVNFFIDSFPAVSLAFEDSIDYLLEKPKKFSKGLIDNQMKILIFLIGIPTSFLLLTIYFLLLRLGFDEKLAQTFMFASFGTYSLFLIFAVRSLQKSIFKYNPFSNLYLLGGVGIGFLLMISAIYLPSLQKLLGTTALPLAWVAGVIGVGAFNILAIEFGKWIYNRRQPSVA